MRGHVFCPDMLSAPLRSMWWREELQLTTVWPADCRMSGLQSGVQHGSKVNCSLLNGLKCYYLLFHQQDEVLGDILLYFEEEGTPCLGETMVHGSCMEALWFRPIMHTHRAEIKMITS